MEETHVFSPQMLNTFRAGFSRAGFNLDSSLLASFPSSLSFVSRAKARRNRHRRRRDHHRRGGITSAGPNNAAGVWNRRNLFTFTDSVQINKGSHQISFGVWFQRCRTTRTPLRASWARRRFASLTTFLQGTVTTFQVVPDPTSSAGEVCSEPGTVEDAIKLRPQSDAPGRHPA